MNVLGIDPSLTGTGLVVASDGGEPAEKALVGTKPGDAIPRIKAILDRVHILLTIYNPDLVVIEGLSFNSKGGMQFDRTGLHYILRWEMAKARVIADQIKIVPPTTLKKFVTGKGNSPKELMLLKTFKRWGVEFSDHNICDAYCLARWGLAYLAGETALPKPKQRKRSK